MEGRFGERLLVETRHHPPDDLANKAANEARLIPGGVEPLAGGSNGGEKTRLPGTQALTTEGPLAPPSSLAQLRERLGESGVDDLDSPTTVSRKELVLGRDAQPIPARTVEEVVDKNPAADSLEQEAQINELAPKNLPPEPARHFPTVGYFRQKGIAEALRKIWNEELEKLTETERRVMIANTVDTLVDERASVAKDAASYLAILKELEVPDSARADILKAFRERVAHYMADGIRVGDPVSNPDQLTADDSYWLLEQALTFARIIVPPGEPDYKDYLQGELQIIEPTAISHDKAAPVPHGDGPTPAPHEPIGMANLSRPGDKEDDNTPAREPMARRIRKFDEKHPDYEEWEDAKNRGDEAEAEEIRKRAEARIKLDILLEPKTPEEEKLERFVQGAEGSTNTDIDVYVYTRRDRLAGLVERMGWLGTVSAEEAYKNIIKEILPEADLANFSDTGALRREVADLLTYELESTLYSPRQIQIIVSKLGLPSDAEAAVMKQIYGSLEEHINIYRGESPDDHPDKLLLSKLIEEDSGFKGWKEQSKAEKSDEATTERTPAERAVDQLLGLLKEENKENYSVEDLRVALLKIPELGEKTREKLTEKDPRNLISYLSLQMRGGRLDVENGEFWASIDPNVRALLIGEMSMIRKSDPELAERAEASLKRYVFNKDTAPISEIELDHDRQLGAIKFDLNGSLHSIKELRQDFEGWLYKDQSQSQAERLKSLKELPFCKAVMKDSQNLEEIIMLNLQNMRYRPGQIEYLLRGAGIDNEQVKSIREGLYENIRHLEGRPTYRTYTSLLTGTREYRRWEDQTQVSSDNGPLKTSEDVVNESDTNQGDQERVEKLADGIIQEFVDYSKNGETNFVVRSEKINAAANNLFRLGLSIEQVYDRLNSMSDLEMRDLYSLKQRYNFYVADLAEPIQFQEALKNREFAHWYGIEERRRRNNIQWVEKKCASGILDKRDREGVVRNLVLGRVREEEFSEVLSTAAPKDKAVIVSDFYKQIRLGPSEYIWIRQWRNNPDYQKWEKSEFSLKELGKSVLSSVKDSLVGKRGQQNTPPVEAPRYPRGDEPRVDENTAFAPLLPRDARRPVRIDDLPATDRDAETAAAQDRFNRKVEKAAETQDSERAAGILLMNARGLLRETGSDGQNKRAAEVLKSSPDLQIETAVALQGAIIEADQRDSIPEIKELVQVAKVLGLDTVPAVRNELSNVLRLYPEIDVNLTEVGS